MIVDGVTKHTCPRCGAENTCIESPEECWSGSHGCQKCNLSFPDDPKLIPEFMRRLNNNG